MTGIFEPTTSSNTIWFDDNMDDCLTLHIEGIEGDVAALETGKANLVHTHSTYADLDHEHTEYALTTHTHTGYATEEHVHTGYADIDHTHTGFAPTAHNHSQYALATDVDALETKVGDTTVSAQISAAIASKADTNHTHSEYAGMNHSHSEYATAEHIHSGYALETHEHDGYAVSSHSHSEYAEATHTHDGYAQSSHIHSYNDLEDKPTIPTTLPANGGNADTVDGKHASDFALASDVTALQTKVGDIAVSEQISIAVSSKANSVHTHAISDVIGLSDELDSKYEKPSTGITKSDLASAVQNSLSKADTAIQSLTGYATESYVNTKVAGLVDSAPETLNTLNELAAALGDNANFANTVATQLGNKVDKVSGKGLSTYDYTEADKKKLGAIQADANKSNFFSSLTDIGITAFPTTMKLVSEAMPKNSMIVIDTRRVNGSGTDYGTETISDWGNDANGVAMIIKGVSTARVGMLILYGTTATTSANIHYGSYAHDENNVNWVNIDDDKFKNKVDKIINQAAVNLNTLTEPGFYYVSSGTTDLNFPIGVNGHLLVMSDGDNRVRQVFMRFGTADTNCFQWYSRTLHTSTWSKWWLISGQEKIWNGGAVLNNEINIGSRYGCQSWIVVARLQNTGAMSSVVIPRAFLTNDTDLYKFQIADETCFISFFIYYKSDNNVYLKVVDQSDNEYTTLKYVYRTT